MNIAFTYITPFHPEKGGVGRVTHNLTQELLKRGHNVYYLIYKCGITVCHQYDYPAPLTYLPSEACLSEENVKAYFQFLRDNKIDIVINQSGNFFDSRLWLKAQELNIKVISVIHTTPWCSYKHLWREIYPLRNNSKIEKLKRIARILLYPKIKYQFRRSRQEHYRWLLPQADCVCTLSAKYFSEISEICAGYEYKLRAIPNPNSYKFDNKQPHNIKKKQLLWVGLFCIEKQPTLAIKIWKRLYRDYPDWEFVIIGYNKTGNNWRERMECMAKGIPNIRFEGYKNPLPYQQDASIFCMTSVYEGWGMVITEAMQCGCVPVAFNSFASVSDIIEDGRNGVLVKPFSVCEYVKALKGLMNNPDKLHKMSDYAMTDVKKFDVEPVVDRWEGLFGEMCKVNK